MFKMRAVMNGIMLLFLLLCSVLDIRKRSLPVWVLCVGTVLALAGGILLCEGSLAVLVLGAVPGMVFVGISRMTGEAIGYADTWMILLLGIYLGMWDVLALTGIAFLLCSIAAAGYLFRRKFRRETAIPFLPFLTAAYLGVVML